jgi:hypothetical protein
LGTVFLKDKHVKPSFLKMWELLRMGITLDEMYSCLDTQKCVRKQKFHALFVLQMTVGMGWRSGSCGREPA